MEAKQIDTGIFIDGKKVIAVELRNNTGSYVKIFNYGTIINKFVVKNSAGIDQDIVLGFDEFEGYLNEDYLSTYPYLGAIIGRYANRIKDGKFNIDGTDYQLVLNCDGNCLHGGTVGFDRKVWDIIQLSEAGRAMVTFQYLSLDGEENFPGDLAIQLSFELTDHNELILTYRADTDEATPINLTHHSYFNLSSNGDKIIDHIHQINADFVLEQDEVYAATGKQLEVAGTLYDFRNPKTIGEDWDKENGYDQSYVLSKSEGDLTLASETKAPDGLTLKIYTTEPVAHFYTAKYLDVKNGKGGKHYQAFDAFCVETQHHPNAVNIPSFPNTILRPDQVYQQTTIYKVIV